VSRDFSAFGVILGQKPDEIRIKVPRARVPDVCRALLDLAPVADLTVTEPPIEEVIRQFFGGKDA